MADSKYGRLFTEADVKHLLLFAAERGEGVGVEALGRDPNGFPVNVGERLLIEWEEAMAALDEREMLVPHRLTFPADEPLFLLRGQDCAAADAIAPIEGLVEPFRWDYWLSAKDDGASPAFLLAVQATATLMRQWQREHPDRVKVPDA